MKHFIVTTAFVMSLLYTQPVSANNTLQSEVINNIMTENFDQFIVIEGLDVCGYKKESEKIKQDYFEIMMYSIDVPEHELETYAQTWISMYAGFKLGFKAGLFTEKGNLTLSSEQCEEIVQKITKIADKIRKKLENE